MKIVRAIAATAIAAAAIALGGAQGVNAQSGNTYSTGFQIQNLSTSTANVTISFYQSGQSSAAATVNTTVEAQKSVTYAQLPSDVAAGFQGGAVVSSDQKVAAIVNVIANGNFFYGASYSGFSAGAKSVSLPLLFKGSFGFNTFFNVQNTGSAAANVTVTYSGGGLSAAVTETKTVQPGSSERFDQSGNASLPAGFNGSATVTSDQDVAVAVVQAGPTTLLSYNGFTGTSTAPLFPLVNANNFGFITGISLQNAGDTATDVTVSYTPSSNGTACTETLTIQPKGTGFFAINAFAKDNAGENCANGATFVGSAKVTGNTGNQPLIGIVNQLNNATRKGGSYDSFDASKATATVVFPLIQDRIAGYFTGFSITNAGSVATPVSCTFSNTTVTQSIGTLAPGATWTENQLNKIANGYNGSGICTASAAGAQIVGVLNQVAPSAATDAFFVSEGINN